VSAEALGVYAFADWGVLI